MAYKKRETYLKEEFNSCSEKELVFVKEMEFQFLFVNFPINDEYLNINQSD